MWKEIDAVFSWVVNPLLKIWSQHLIKTIWLCSYKVDEETLVIYAILFDGTLFNISNVNSSSD